MNGYVPAVLLGTAIGDALGMPFESWGCGIHKGLENWDGKSFLPGTYHKHPAGHWTDDTEMSMALAQSLLAENRFKGEITAKHYVDWYKGNPTGMGSSTRLALERLDQYGIDEYGWSRQGTKFDDPEAVGSGTAMRAAPIGVMYADVPEMIRKVCREDAYITHADKEAYASSLVVASTVGAIIRYKQLNPTTSHFTWQSISRIVEKQLLVVHDTITARAVRHAINSAKEGGNTDEEFADEVSGRFGAAWQCVSTALHCVFRGWSGGFELAVRNAVKLGGDTDTRGAIVGSIMGAKVGIEGIPRNFLNGVADGANLVEMDHLLYKRRMPRDGQPVHLELH